MKCSSILSLACLAAVATANAATVTTQLKINFDGSLSGVTYTTGVGEIVQNGTFGANGTPTVGSGKASLDGTTSPATNTDGFKYSTTLGSLSGTNWVAEAIISFDAFGTGQQTMIDVQGDTDFRINNGGTALEAIYYDGSAPLNGPTTIALPATGTFHHYALVWDAVATSLTAYVDGVSVGVGDDAAHATPDLTNISFGYLGRSGVVGRGIDGQLDAVSFGTFTGTFDPASNFVIPEPSAALLGGLGLLGLLRRRRA